MGEAGGHKKTVYLSLGSNRGDRAANLERALAALGEAGVAVRRRSAVYETEPLDVPDQPWFLNCVVEVETELMPLGLLRAVERIERQLGRNRSGALPAPRTIDIDIVLFGNHVVRSPELTIPHPRLAERRFVLEPLRELAPELRHPITRKTPAEMLAELTSRAQVRRYAG
ncbi:MAG: 2-amino-4-hydroxy-6-hydroxymethyldihydropteridine diphosphokinase [Terriglobia bacterium]